MLFLCHWLCLKNGMVHNFIGTTVLFLCHWLCLKNGMIHNFNNSFTCNVSSNTLDPRLEAEEIIFSSSSFCVQTANLLLQVIHWVCMILFYYKCINKSNYLYNSFHLFLDVDVIFIYLILAAGVLSSVLHSRAPMKC